MRVNTLKGQFGFLRPIAADTTSDGRRWQLAAEAGVWFNQRHGEITISLDDISEMHSNFQSRAYPQGPQQLPIDYEHLSVKADRRPGDGKAAGWIHDTQIRNDGKELWALVEWTDEATEKIQKKEFKGFSPLFAPKWIAHGGKELGATLLGGALTNYQTIPNCVVTFSNDATLGGDARLLASFSDLQFSEREQRLREAFGIAYPPQYRSDSSINWDTYRSFMSADDDNVYFAMGSKRYALPYSVDDDLAVTFTGTEYEILLTPTPVIAASHQEGSIMKVKTADGKEVEVAKDFLTTLSLDALSEIPAVKTLRDRQVDPTQLSTMQASIDTLSGTVNALSSTVEAQKATIKNEQDARVAAEAKLLDQELAGLQSQGRLLPAEVETFKELALSNRPLFDKMVAARKAADPIVKVNTEAGRSGTGATGGPIVMFDQAIAEYRKAHPAVTMADAILAVQNEKPDLAKARLEAMQLSSIVGGIGGIGVPEIS